MLTHFQLRELGFIPKTSYTVGRAFPEGFLLPETCDNATFKKLPLFINIRYTFPADGNNIHHLKGQNVYHSKNQS